MDGTLSEDEFRWLTLRAKGGFGLTMTCAAHVQRIGQGFPGQLGIFSDEHIPGLARLASRIRSEGSIAVAQLHHAGMRSPAELIGQQPVCPSDNQETKARALSGAEVEQLADDFIAAAVRAERSGFDGVELHNAHGYILAQFLSSEINLRNDKWGGTLDNRVRLLNLIIDGIRARTRDDFSLGVRLSPERFGLKLAETREVAGALMASGKLDYLDISLWDVFKKPVETEFTDSLMSYFTSLNRSKTRLGVAGKIASADDVRRVLGGGADFAIIGRAAILHHDYPHRVSADPHFAPVALPVTEAYLREQGLGEKFVGYMRGWKGFVAEGAAQA
ncbi:MAG: NADH:flavin oxidoreductase [Alphaproteobacteria bacterium]|nr:NADH:flavin oxidoreductase [Alphaproteobacteria bacterium]